MYEFGSRMLQIQDATVLSTGCTYSLELSFNKMQEGSMILTSCTLKLVQASTYTGLKSKNMEILKSIIVIVAHKTIQWKSPPSGRNRDSHGEVQRPSRNTVTMSRVIIPYKLAKPDACHIKYD